jgi:hypothetical protein
MSAAGLQGNFQRIFSRQSSKYVTLDDNETHQPFQRPSESQSSQAESGRKSPLPWTSKILKLVLGKESDEEVVRLLGRSEGE